mmetsp:Transcript_62744/g.146059  ORF Transcript_62744/g.146059 Transcript_62744/m.146059 type:complete len:208 (-) Transcript_62744:1371-1994(-)
MTSLSFSSSTEARDVHKGLWALPQGRSDTHRDKILDKCGQVGRCMEFASIRTALAPSVDALVSCEASLSAWSRDLRGGPRIVKTRWRPEWLLPPCGIVICACHTVSLPPTAKRSTTSAWKTSPVCSAATVLCGILAFSRRFKEPDLDRDFSGLVLRVSARSVRSTGMECWGDVDLGLTPDDCCLGDARCCERLFDRCCALSVAAGLR